MTKSRRILRRVHLLVSLAAGFWLAASGLSGSLLVFGDALDRAAHPVLFTVRGTVSLSLDEVVARVEQETRGRVTRIRLAGSRTPVHELWLDCDDCRRAFVDPTTGAINGIRSPYGTVRTWIHEFHRRLLVRGAGDVAALAGGVAMLLLGLTGITLGWRGGLRLRRASTYEIHRVVGLVASPLLVIAAATGIYFIAAGLQSAARAIPAFAPAAGLDHALRVARNEFAAAEATWISFGRDEVVIRLRQPREAHPNGRTFVRVRRERVITRTDALSAAPSRKALDAFYPLHTGAFGGLGHRVLLVGLGVTPAILMITGVFLWLRRSTRVRQTPATETFSNTSEGTRLEE